MYLFAATSTPMTTTVAPTTAKSLLTSSESVPIPPDDLHSCMFYKQETALDLFNVHMKYNVRQNDQGRNCH